MPAGTVTTEPGAAASTRAWRLGVWACAGEMETALAHTAIATVNCVAIFHADHIAAFLPVPSDSGIRGHSNALGRVGAHRLLTARLPGGYVFDERSGGRCARDSDDDQK